MVEVTSPRPRFRKLRESRARLDRLLNVALALLILTAGTIFGTLLLATDAFGLVNITRLLEPPWDWVATWAYMLALANLAMWAAGYFRAAPETGKDPREMG